MLVLLTLRWQWRVIYEINKKNAREKMMVRSRIWNGFPSVPTFL
jgi:hypothetical protein